MACPVIIRVEETDSAMKKGNLVGKVFEIVLACLMIGSMLVFGSFAFQSQALAQDGKHENVTPKLKEQLADIRQRKENLTPTQRKIDSNIIQLVWEIEERISATPPGYAPGLQDLSAGMLKLDNTGEIEVRLTVDNMTDYHLERLKALGMDVNIILPKYGVVEGSLPYHKVEAVAGLDFVLCVGMPGYAIHNTGDVTSEGDSVLRAADARSTFGVDGSGSKIGVISDGVDHLADSVASGDLPSFPAVDVLQSGRGDEGTAILEIIHDLAPGAELAFYSPTTESDMEFGIGALERAGCNIIVDDLTFSNEPKFEDGMIAQRARQFVADGGVYVTSAGNSGETHYNHTYNPVYSFPLNSNVHDYDMGGGTDEGNTFTIPSGYGIIAILQWNNQWGRGPMDDLDFYLIDSDLSVKLGWSENNQESGFFPYSWEGFAYMNDTGSTIEVDIVIAEWSLVSPPSALVLDYHVWYCPSPLQYYTPEDSVIGHAAVEEVLSTAAVDAATPDMLESFSSRGPGTIYFPIYEERQVPNITGVDGVQTKTGQLGYFINPFYGTSASAPHIAAIAALVWEYCPMLTSSEVFDVMTSTAVDLPPAGWDINSGFGRADAYDAVDSLVKVPPSVITHAATNTEETTATLNGEIIDVVCEDCDYRGFVWDNQSRSDPGNTAPASTDYDSNWTQIGSYGTGTFSHSISGLDKGTKYYCRACAYNTAGWSYGSEQSFITKPDAPTDFSAVDVSASQINLSWTKGDGAEKTKIQRKMDSYPSDRNDGTEVYFDTGTSKPDTGLTEGITYCYRAWSYVQGSEQWSDDYAQASAPPTPSGDANGNGVIDMSDVTKVERIILELDDETPGADANQDGFIDMADVTKIERIILGVSTIMVNATLDGSPWSGIVNYNILGPKADSGSFVPHVFSNSPAGTYTLSYSSGGPAGATLVSISPSPIQTLPTGGSITFTLNFST